MRLNRRQLQSGNSNIVMYQIQDLRDRESQIKKKLKVIKNDAVTTNLNGQKNQVIEETEQHIESQNS